MKVIHHGSSQFDLKKWREVANSESKGFNKPRTGGLWTSPVGCETSWADWCLSEDFRLHHLLQAFTVNIEGNILTIDDPSDMEGLPLLEGLERYNKGGEVMDFEAIKAMGYDAIHLTTRGFYSMRGLGYRGSPKYSGMFYSWDCETVLVLNRECIKGWQTHVLSHEETTCIHDAIEEEQRYQEELEDRLARMKL